MTLTSCSDQELDRLLRKSDPVDRGALERDDVLKVSDQLFDAVLHEAGAGRGRASSAPQTARRRRRWLPRSRVGLIGAVALAAVIAGVIIAVVGSSGSPHGRESAKSPALPSKVAPPLTASVVLERAADVARRQPVQAAAHQWVYLNTLTGLTSSGGARDATGRPYGVRFWQTSTDRWWIKNSGARRELTTDLHERFFSARDAAIARAHGKTLAQLDNVALGRRIDSFFPADDEPRTRANGGFFGPALPTQPTALLRALKREERNLAEPAHPRPDVTTYGLFNLITGRLLVDSTSPPLRAALFRVLARLPGIRLLGDRRDRLGRLGVAVSIPAMPGGGGHGPSAPVVLIDPKTSNVLETELVYVTRSPGGTRGALSFPAGTPISYTVYRQRAIVNSDEQLPDGRKIPRSGPLAGGR